MRDASEYWGSYVCNSDISLLYWYPGIVYPGQVAIRPELTLLAVGWAEDTPLFHFFKDFHKSAKNLLKL